MYTTSIKYSRHVLGVIISCMVFCIANANAQERVVSYIQNSSLNPVQTDLFVSASGGIVNNRRLKTATNHESKARNIYGNFLSVGIKSEFYKQSLNLLRFSAGVGYKNDFYSYESGFLYGAGVDSHWITTELGVSFSYFNVGLTSDFFLGSQSKQSDKDVLLGLYSDSFNRASLAWNLGFNVRSSSFLLNARFGFYLIPHLDPRRISQNNLIKNTVNGFFFEVGFAYRVFTTAKRNEGMEF